VEKARIVHDFRTTASSDALRSIVCVSCAERVHASGASNMLVSDIDLDILHGPQPASSEQTGPVPPLSHPYTDGPLAGILVDRLDEDGFHSRFSLWKLDYAGVVCLIITGHPHKLCSIYLTRHHLPHGSMVYKVVVIDCMIRARTTRPGLCRLPALRLIIK